MGHVNNVCLSRRDRLSVYTGHTPCVTDWFLCDRQLWQCDL